MKKKQNERKKTGLNDRKGKEIREGDVVIMEGWKGLLGIVEYQEPHFWVSVHNEKYGAADLIWINWHEEVEVIGNIYDQPELISKAATSKYIYEDNLPFVSFPAHNFFARDAHNRCQASLILFQERDDMFIMSTLACQHVTQHNNISFSHGKSIRGVEGDNKFGPEPSKSIVYPHDILNIQLTGARI